MVSRRLAATPFALDVRTIVGYSRFRQETPEGPPTTAPIPAPSIAITPCSWLFPPMTAPIPAPISAPAIQLFTHLDAVQPAVKESNAAPVRNEIHPPTYLHDSFPCHPSPIGGLCVAKKEYTEKGGALAVSEVTSRVYAQSAASPGKSPASKNSIVPPTGGRGEKVERLLGDLSVQFANERAHSFLCDRITQCKTDSCF